MTIKPSTLYFLNIKIILSGLLVFPVFLKAQVSEERLVSFSQLYSELRFFYPNKTTEDDWWRFLVNGINVIESEKTNDIQLFDSIFKPVCPEIEI